MIENKRWRDAVLDAIHRRVAVNNSRDFTRAELMEHELARIIEETQSTGDTPEQTLSRELQGLRDESIVEFVEAGSYRLV